MTKRKHADLIFAWANGAKIQFLSDLFGGWYDCDEDGNKPLWYDDTEYRVKPEKYPTTTLTSEELDGFYFDSCKGHREALKHVANKAIERHIMETKGEINEKV